jgi:CHRD domain-containing protein
MEEASAMNVLRLSLAAAVVIGASTVGASGASALTAVLTGAQQVGTPGDPDGFGTAAVEIVSPTKICFGIVVSKIDKPVEFHIHKGAKGTNGDVVIPFIPPKGGNPGTGSGCTSGVSTVLLNQIKRNPTGFYVNVHTVKFPEGAIRGQLFNPVAP